MTERTKQRLGLQLPWLRSAGSARRGETVSASLSLRLMKESEVQMQMHASHVKRTEVAKNKRMLI